MNVPEQHCLPSEGKVNALVRVSAISDTQIELEAVAAGSAGVCARCDEGRGCGQSLLVRLRRKSDKPITLKVEQLANGDDWRGKAAIGTVCRLEIGSGSLLKMTVLLYGLPLIGLIVGTVVSYAAVTSFNTDVSALQQDLLAAGSGMLGMILGTRLVKNLSPLSYCEVRLHPQV
ncbi:MAG: hypothetical protein CME36_19020 [unclassified Hahellaceae]|nr:hypothetical protein [Hahellaceae bacterium]